MPATTHLHASPPTAGAARGSPEAALELIGTPLAVIAKLFEGQGVQGNGDYQPQEFSQLVRDHFRAAFACAEATQRIPVFHRPGALKSGSLVRFRCMVQDPSYGEELHLSLAQIVNSETGETQQKFSQFTDVDHCLPDGWEVDYSSAGNVFTEKEVAYCVSVPGLSPWAQLETAVSLESAMGALSIGAAGAAEEGGPATVVEVDEQKFPLCGESHAAALVKFYSPSTAPKVSTMIDVVGIFELGHNSRAKDADGETATWPCIHAIYYTEVAPGSLVPGVPAPVRGEYTDRRTMCLAHLASVLGGDELAAQYLLLHLVSRTVCVQDAKVGKFSLNLIGMPAQAKASAEPARFALNGPASRWVGDAVAQLVPLSVEIPFDLALLNRAAFVPNAEQGSLRAGVLQLVSGTEVICDETCLHEGTLGESGVRNLHALQTVVLNQSIGYVYPYQSIEMPTNLRVLVLSVGKSILQNDCDLHLSKDATQFLARIQDGEPAVLQPLDPMHAEQIRQYLAAARHLEFSIPKDVSDAISAEYVDMRRAAHEQGGRLMTQEELALT
ncbi:hypothetical protein H4R19_005593, partial [Coemansia spiralis]